MRNPLTGLEPEVLNIVARKAYNYEITEAQINYILIANKVDRETFDEAVEYAICTKSIHDKRMKASCLLVIAFVASVGFLLYEFIGLFFNGR